MKIVITGCTGFIGTHLAPALLESGHEVKGTVEPGGANIMKDLPLFAVNVCNGIGFMDAFEGAEAVIHLAARNHVLQERAKDPLAEYRRVNVEGTRNVLQAASDVGARIFFHMSSVKAMGEGAGSVLDEGAECRPETPYGVSKRESEAVVRDGTDGTGMTSVVLRLPMVYGPGNKGNLPRMIRWAERGFPFPTFHPENSRSMVYVENVVAGIIAVLNAPPHESATYIFKDREDYSSRKVYDAICDALGKKPRYLPVPFPVVRLGGLLSEDFRKMTGSFRVSSAKFVEDFHFEPPFSLEEGIARTVRWYRCSAR